MGACIKMASLHYGSGEIVLYRGVVGALLMAGIARWRGESLRTAVPGRHFWRSASGVIALALWFYAIAGLPLATAMTLNYTSSIWLAALLLAAGVVGAGGASRAPLRLLALVAAGFAGVVLVMRPTVEERQLGFALAGLLSGAVSAVGYLQVRRLSQGGEPETRIVFYFCCGGIVGGAALATASGWHAHTAAGLGWMLAVGVLATLGQLMITRAYAQGSMLVSASLQYLGIAFSFVYGALLFDDSVTAGALAGMALIVVAGIEAARWRARGAVPGRRKDD
jgi:S-adenosylmethionine uptake transporter